MNDNEPVILGKVKKGAVGKPLVVLIIFLFIGSFILFLPSIINYFGDYNIVDLIKNGEIADFFINHDLYVDKQSSNNKEKEESNEIKPMLINTKTIITNNSITLTNFLLDEKSIKFNINIKTNIDLEESNYYLVLSQNDKEISTIKIMGSEVNYKFKTPLENTIEVKGIIKQIRENEYPKYIVSSDESGLGSLVCEKDNYKIEYILNNNNLIRIKETLNYLDNNDNYLLTFEEYSKKSTKLNNSNASSTIIENYSGFIFTSDIDLNTYTGIEKNYNYYSLNTKTNKIYFEMNAKGYDCK